MTDEMTQEEFSKVFNDILLKKTKLIANLIKINTPMGTTLETATWIDALFEHLLQMFKIIYLQSMTLNEKNNANKIFDQAVKKIIETKCELNQQSEKTEI
jgi:hypothetical protein